MGFYFRKSLRAGPFRINVGKSGVGWSVGGGGFRTGRTARKRSYTTFSIPGTGAGYRTSKGCAPLIALAAAAVLCAGWQLWSVWT